MFIEKVLELLDILIENDKKDMDLDNKIRTQILFMYKNKDENKVIWD